MSVGTIVTIVLLMSVLILGLMLIKNIFFSAKKAIDLTDDQLKKEINKMFSGEEKLLIYPSSEQTIPIKQGELSAVGIGIKNLLEGVQGTQRFSYDVIAIDASDCQESEQKVESWIILGGSGENIPILVGEWYVEHIQFRIPGGSTLCVLRFRVEVYTEGEFYASRTFDLEIKAA